MNAVKNAVLASCVAYGLLFLALVLAGKSISNPMIFALIPCVGLIVWSLSGRKKIVP